MRIHIKGRLFFLLSNFSTYTMQYVLKLFRLTPIELCHFRDRLCYISRKPLLPVRHQITQELVLKLHPIEIPKTLVDFQPFRNGSFSQNIKKLMKKLILLRRRGLDPSIGIHHQGSLFPDHSFHTITSLYSRYVSQVYFLYLITPLNIMRGIYYHPSSITINSIR